MENKNVDWSRSVANPFQPKPFFLALRGHMSGIPALSAGIHIQPVHIHVAGQSAPTTNRVAAYLVKLVHVTERPMTCLLPVYENFLCLLLVPAALSEFSHTTTPFESSYTTVDKHLIKVIR